MKTQTKVPISILVASIGAIASIIVAYIGIIPLLNTAERLSTPEAIAKDISIRAENPIMLTAPFLVLTYFFPSGWMGDGKQGDKNISLNPDFRGKPRLNDTDNVCIKVTYKIGPERWAGIYWQYPDGNWGDSPGRKITGATKVNFWASGEKGDEVVEFKAGGIRDPKKPYGDKFEISLGRVSLTREWKRYEISIAGQDISNVIGAFAWVATGSANPDGVTFYLDDIRYE